MPFTCVDGSKDVNVDQIIKTNKFPHNIITSPELILKKNQLLARIVKKEEQEEEVKAKVVQRSRQRNLPQLDSEVNLSFQQATNSKAMLMTSQFNNTSGDLSSWSGEHQSRFEF